MRFGRLEHYNNKAANYYLIGAFVELCSTQPSFSLLG
jgi:hypothetical protein